MDCAKFAFILCVIGFVCGRSPVSDAQKCASSAAVRFSGTYVCEQVQTLNEIAVEASDNWRVLVVKNKPGSEFVLTALEQAKRLVFVKKLDLSQAGALSASVDGGFQGFPTLHTLNISGCGFSTLKSQHFVYPYTRISPVENLDASRNDLRELTAAQLASLGRLQWANFSHNDLQKIEVGTFEHMGWLEYLDLNNNNLNQAAIGACPRLRHLSMADNNIKRLSSADFSDLPALEYLSISGNSLEHIEDNTFEKLSWLRILNLSGNSLSELLPGVFSARNMELFNLDLSLNDLIALPALDLPRLEVFNISGNQLKSLKEPDFQKLSGLRKIFVYDNDIVAVGANTFANLFVLDTIDLSKNAIVNLSQHAFGDQLLPRMRKLILNENNLQQLHPLTFATMPFLEYLSLGNNELTTLDIRMFAPMRHLQKLHLGHNQLDQIPGEILHALRGVMELLLDNNRLSFLPAVEVEFPYLQKMSLEGNPWQCTCLNEIFEWLDKRQVQYIRPQSPFYVGRKPLCTITSAEHCLRDLNYIKQQGVVESFERMLKS